MQDTNKLFTRSMVAKLSPRFLEGIGPSIIGAFKIFLAQIEELGPDRLVGLKVRLRQSLSKFHKCALKVLKSPLGH